MESGVALSRQTDARDETERVRRHYEDLAPKYDKLIRFAEKILFRNGRRWACSQAAGDVLEVAIGTQAIAGFGRR